MNVFGTRVWTLEDPKQEHKVYGNTRVPAGKYELELRNEGGMTQRYARRFPEMHEGMIWLREVPMFEWVYIHIGNTEADTEGCILVGTDTSEDAIINSKVAYQLIYPKIIGALKQGRVTLEIKD
jgi:hypothetical protein